MIKTLLTAVLMAVSFSASAYEAMVDGFSDENVVDSIVFTGEPGYESTAAFLKYGDEEPIFVIIQQEPGDVRYYQTLENLNLGLIVSTPGNYVGNESSLAVSKNGSLQIKQQNQGIGRDRWERTLTVAFRNGKYMIAGFTYSYYDSLQIEDPQNCDYNLITKKGVRNGKQVKIKTGMIPLKTAVDNEKWYSCSGW